MTKVLCSLRLLHQQPLHCCRIMPNVYRRSTATGGGDTATAGDATLTPTQQSDTQLLTSLGFRVYNKVIGIGHYSKVLLVENRNLRLADGDVRAMAAVKVVDLSRVSSDYCNRFLSRERCLWEEIDHPRIVKLLGCFTNKTRVYMMMQWCSGGDLLTHIQRRGVGVGDNEARDTMHQLLAGASYLHDCKIAHRDLKLENILIDANRFLKIADFGFCRRMEKSELSSTFCGSKAYSSPEVLLGQEYDPFRSDVWALGVILFILITNRMPFNENVSNRRIVQAQRDQNFRFGTGARAMVTTACQEMIAYALLFEWKNRPTIYQLQRHHWLTDANDAASTTDVNTGGGSGSASSSTPITG